MCLRLKHVPMLMERYKSRKRKKSDAKEGMDDLVCKLLI